MQVDLVLPRAGDEHVPSAREPSLAVSVRIEPDRDLLGRLGCAVDQGREVGDVRLGRPLCGAGAPATAQTGR